MVVNGSDVDPLPATITNTHERQKITPLTNVNCRLACNLLIPVLPVIVAGLLLPAQLMATTEIV